MPRRKATKAIEAEFYKHPESESLLRPDVGTQAQFRKKKPPQKYKYDSSLSPELQWDGQNAAREEAEQRMATAIEQLSQVRKKISEANIEKIVADNPSLAREAVLRIVAEHFDAADHALLEVMAMSCP